MNRGIVCLFLLFLFGKAVAQSGNLTNQVISQYKKAHPSNVLFLHIDKTIYTNNETIWFSAYLINNQSVNIDLHNVLSVFLAGSNNQKIEICEKYEMEKGLCFGSLSLPDTIPPGKYQLLAYTNVLDKDGRPVAVFSAPVIIKSITQQDFKSSITLLDSAVTNGAVRVRLTVILNEPKPKIFPKVDYAIGKNMVHSAVLKSNELTITIPQEQLALDKPALLTAIKYNKQVQYLEIRLPQLNQNKVAVRFFPEGGDLSDGLPCTVAWEAKTDKGVPIALKGFLFKDNKTIDTVETNAYGAGSFQLKPEGRSNYTLKINGGSYLKHDTVFTLPKIINNGIVLHLAHAVANDTLRVSLLCKEKQPLQILVRSYLGAYTLFKAQALPDGNLLKLPLDSLPKGIATITILNEEGKPLAERLFFAHYNDRTVTSIKTEKESYGKKETVKVSIKITDRFGKPVQGIFSAAAVQDNRLTTGFLNIENYVYLNYDLGTLPQDPSGEGFDNKEYLENMLLIKGWRRYTWQDLVNSTANDTIQNYRSPVITGIAKRYGKALKAPVSIVRMGSTDLKLITTENDGSFNLDREKLLSADGKKIGLMVGGKNNNGYTIEVNDSYSQINRQLADSIKPGNSGNVRNNSNSDDQVISGPEMVHNLQTVTIKASGGTNTPYGFIREEPGMNDCGDYVDEAEQLNWPHSEHRFKPIVGKLYKHRTDYPNSRAFRVDPIIYMGCEAERNKAVLLRISGIYGQREFYGVIDNITEPQFLSTLYWKPGIITDSNGKAEFSFSTGDIAGQFRIVAQGLTKDNLIYGTGSFTVK